MKLLKLIFTLCILAACVHQAKARHRFGMKQADSLPGDMLNKYFKPEPQNHRYLLMPKFNPDEYPGAVNNGNFSLKGRAAFYSRMPVIALPGYSKMPVVKLESDDRMPVKWTDPVNPVIGKLKPVSDRPDFNNRLPAIAPLPKL